jgi:universal stress protein A
MFRHILVPSDLTDRTIPALEIAIRMGRQEHARITLLHVIETITDTHFDELLSFYGQLERRAGERLKEIAGNAAAGQPPPAIEIVYGKRLEEVLRFVRANQVDLIVLASHPVDPSQPSGGLGTLSYKLGALGPCAVLLVK